MRLAKATTLSQTVDTLSDWVADPETPLPSCEDLAS
jgi:PDZ domain-containing protein